MNQETARPGSTDHPERGTGNADPSARVSDDSSGILQLRPTVVRASAGTGKTYQLTARLLRILLQGASPETILATTFTRKAAGEILQRVLLTLAQAGDENRDESLADLRNQVGLKTLPKSRCQSLLQDLITNIHRIRISTLDSVFSALARSLPFELGLPPAWRLTDEVEEEWLREQAINDLIAAAETSELKSLLAMLGGGRVARSIAQEISQVIESTYDRQRLCESNLWEEVVVPKAPSETDLRTMIDSFRGAEVKQKTLRAKLDLCADFAEQGRLDELAEETLILNIAKARRTATEIKLGRSTFPEDLNEAFDVLYEAVKSSCLRTLSAQNTATGSLLEIYESQITTLKNSQRSLGFDDVAVRLAKHFQSLIQQSNGRLIDHRMDGAIDHLLLDEFQDTSPVQWNVLRPIAERTTVGDRTTIDGDVSVPRSFFCVGDTKQAIYGFRGGVAEIFDAVTDQLDGVEEIAQNESYRSSPVVLDFVTEVFQHLHLHPSVADPTGDPADPATHHAESIGRFSRDFPGHFAARKKLPGHVQVVSSASKSDLGTEAKSDDLKSSRFDSAAGLVQDLHQQAPTIDIGILTRSRAAAAEMMWRLDQRGLLVSQEGGNPLTDSAAVELVLSTLMMVEHPGDRRWHFHVSNSPIRDKVFGDTMEDVENACAELRERLTDEGLVATVVSLADAIVPYCDPTDTIRLKQLSQLATGYQPTASPRLRDFVRMVRSKGVEQPKAAKIRVMTIHASKGLEFDAVVLPDLDAPLVRPSQTSVMDSPSIDEPPRGLTRYLNKKKRHFLSRRWQDAFGRQDSADMTEALCLMYVAMTRAKHSLQLVVQPMTKRDSATKSAASLVLHSLKSIKDPTASQTLLYESGSPNWHESFSTRDEADSSPESSTPAQVTFRAGSSQAIGQS